MVVSASHHSVDLKKYPNKPTKYLLRPQTNQAALNMSDFTKSSDLAGSYYDVIVVGLGGHGSATLAEIAKATQGEKSVLGLEQFKTTHANGSSHGRSRIYRQAYFEHPGCESILSLQVYFSQSLCR
jgi:hypothetical protein